MRWEVGKDFCMGGEAGIPSSDFFQGAFVVCVLLYLFRRDAGGARRVPWFLHQAGALEELTNGLYLALRVLKSGTGPAGGWLDRGWGMQKVVHRMKADQSCGRISRLCFGVLGGGDRFAHRSHWSLGLLRDHWTILC